jgi:hypothetical protein
MVGIGTYLPVEHLRLLQTHYLLYTVTCTIDTGHDLRKESDHVVFGWLWGLLQRSK